MCFKIMKLIDHTIINTKTFNIKLIKSHYF